jgi:signal transduction histidine kinase
VKLWLAAVAAGVLAVALMFGAVGIGDVSGVVVSLIVTGIFLGLCIVLAIRWARGLWRGIRAGLRGEKKGPPTLQAILFRVVLVTLFVFFLAVLGVRWYADWQSSRTADFSTTDEAVARLQIAYRTQPAAGREDGSSPGMPYVGGKGLWIDAADYRRIDEVIDFSKTRGGSSGALLLNGGDSYPLRAVVPPPVYREWKATGSPDILNPSYDFPSMILPERPTLRVLVRRGNLVGRTWFKDEQQWVRYALWRTGPDAGFYVWSYERSGHDTVWYASAIGWALQGVWVYIFLAPFAGVTAWYLNRRIARPVAQVAAASEILADGDLPERIPEEGPAELATMARSFNRLSDRLDEAEAAQREFVASVNHELKTPLTSLQGYGELLSDGAVSAEEAGQVVLAETARLERLVGDLLDSARMDSGTFSVRDQDVPLDRVAEAVLQRCQGAAREFGISLDARHEPAGEALARADEDRLVQVVGNLVENALRCTPSGGSVRIVVSAPSTIRVVDTGPGLAEEDVPHAFERFYLYEKYGKERPVGTGLGLSIVRELVEAMGGTVAVQSEPGAGTTFTVGLRPAGEGPSPVDASLWPEG